MFPERLADRAKLTGQAAASAVFVCLYSGAVGDARRIRPSMVVWMCNEAARRTSEHDRNAWYQAALGSHSKVIQLLRSWGKSHSPWYKENSREFRDDVLPPLERHGAVVRDYSWGPIHPGLDGPSRRSL